MVMIRLIWSRLLICIWMFIRIKQVLGQRVVEDAYSTTRDKSVRVRFSEPPRASFVWRHGIQPDRLYKSNQSIHTRRARMCTYTWRQRPRHSASAPPPPPPPHARAGAAGAAAASGRRRGRSSARRPASASAPRWVGPPACLFVYVFLIAPCFRFLDRPFVYILHTYVHHHDRAAWRGACPRTSRAC